MLDGKNITGGHCKDPIIILLVVVSNDLWICHLVVGLPSSHSDQNVLSRSPQFARLVYLCINCAFPRHYSHDKFMYQN
jgi:hypothetical protein